MSKFSDYEKKEILGSWDKLRDFQNGADIEEIFNRIRPKYPIRRYEEVIKKIDRFDDIWDMKYKSLSEASKEEIEVIKSWIDFIECKKIRAVFYGENLNLKYIKEAQILDNMLHKYDSFLDKNETIYRGIRFSDKEEFNILIDTYFEALKHNGLIEIDRAPSSFSRNKKIAYEEFARADSDKFYSIIFKLKKRKNGELYIKEYAGKFAYQEEIIIKSHKSKFKIIDIKENEEYNKTYEIIIEEL